MLFKYLPEERVDVLEKMRIRFSPLKSLNDPFEALPLVDMNADFEKIRREVLSDLEGVWNNASERDKTEENRELMEESKRQCINDIKNNLSSQKVGIGLMDILKDRFCLLSLSRSNDNLLMWSHYANNYHGFVIGFDEKHIFFRQKDMAGKIVEPISVIYSKTRLSASAGDSDYYQKMFCSKPVDWAYEEEVRLFRTYLNSSGEVRVDNYGQRIHLEAVPKDAIKSVYIGYRASQKTRDSIMKSIKRYGLKCLVYEANVANEKYEVIFNEIEKA